MIKWETKSLASSEMPSKASSSKYQLAARTLFRVSVSLSPKNGERPLSLRRGEDKAVQIKSSTAQEHN